jgi:ribosome-associated toxin RatA of RatAB toxin-antitoxin module
LKKKIIIDIGGKIMVHLETSIIINQNMDIVYKLAESIEKFPEFMPHVKTSNIIKKQGKTRHVVVSAVVNGINAHWISESSTEKNKKITYKQIKGSCKIMGGEWRFKKVLAGTMITIIHDFDLGWPVIGNLIGRIIVKNWVEKYSQLTLSRIKLKAESSRKA